MPTQLKQRKPMARGKGFKPKTAPRILRRERVETIVVEYDKRAKEMQARELAESAPFKAIQSLHRGTYAASTTVPAPKPEVHRNARLLAMAEGKPCLFRLPGICNHDWTTTVAAHSNMGAHGKAKSRKANDEFSAVACAACHHWYDQDKRPTYEEKCDAFMAAHLRQVLEWRRIAADPRAPEADRRAARWALDQLNATPVGTDSPTTS